MTQFTFIVISIREDKHGVDGKPYSWAVHYSGQVKESEIFYSTVSVAIDDAAKAAVQLTTHKETTDGIQK